MRKQLGIYAFVAMMLAGMVWGVTCTFDNPTTVVGTRNTYISGANQNVSVHVAGWALGQNSTAARVSVSSGTISGALVINYTGGPNSTYLNTSVNTLLLKDDTSYVFTMQIFNNSNGALIGSCNSGAIIPDNTKPGCAFSQSSNTKYAPTQTWSIVGGNASSAIVTFGSLPTHQMTETTSGDVFTWTGDKNSLPGTVYSSVAATISDGLNTTSCNLNYVTVSAGAPLIPTAAALAAQQDGQSAKLASAAQTQQKKSNSNSTALVVAVILIGGYFAVKKGKK